MDSLFVFILRWTAPEFICKSTDSFILRRTKKLQSEDQLKRKRERKTKRERARERKNERERERERKKERARTFLPWLRPKALKRI